MIIMEDDALGHLPPTSSNLLEISFCRLLASCEDITQGLNIARADLKDWKTSPVFHHYIETLQEQLADLVDSGIVHSDVLEAYRRRTVSLSSQLKRAEISEFSRLLAPFQISTTTNTNNDTTTDIHSNTSNGKRSVPPPGITVVPKVDYSLAAPKKDQTRPDLKPISISAAAQAQLGSHSRAQEALTDELVELAAAMKTKTLAMEAKVKERGTLVDGAERALGKSAADVKHAATRASAIHRRGRVNFCFSILVLFIIGTLFVGMYIFIRITSLTGYKRAAAKAPSPLSVPPRMPEQRQIEL